MAQTAYRLFTISFALCLSVACTATSPPAAPSPPPTPTIPAETADSQIIQTAQAFQKLRPAIGQFNGGEWNPPIDEWEGEKHSLMLALQAHVNSSEMSGEALTKLIGEPDQLVQGGDPLFEQLSALTNVETAVTVQDELLIYEWRGSHDFLFFVCRAGTIVHSNWWYAGE